MVGTALKVRPALPSDAEAVCVIYNQGIEDRVATLETRLRTPQEQREWLDSRDERHPVIIAENDDGIVGWASLNTFNPRPAYERVADFSVYVSRACRGKGVGGRLLDELIELARNIGYHKMVLAMFDWNTAGIALYRRRGFREVGVYREQAMLDGRWVDTVIMEKILSD